MNHNSIPLKLLISEFHRRLRGDSSSMGLTDPDFKEQTAFVNDDAPFVYARCTRRAGKTMGACIKLLKAMEENPGSTVLYLGLTRESAKRILWKDCFLYLVRKHALRMQVNHTVLSATNHLGSLLYVQGADANEKEIEKLLGQKYSLVIIDEAASFKRNLRELVYSILKPAVADYRGQICLIGTARNHRTGLFYDISANNEPGWSKHTWSALDNPYMRDNFLAEMNELKTLNPGIEATPAFKQMYLNQWEVDESLLVYKASRTENKGEFIPKDPVYILGIDFGFDPDPTAMVFCAYNKGEGVLYVLETFQKKKMLMDEISETVQYFYNQVPGYHVEAIADGANKALLHELNHRYPLHLRTADKTKKEEFIELFNADLLFKRVRVTELAEDMFTEWENLVWEEDTIPRKEKDGCDNHKSDALLYAWRKAYHYVVKKEKRLNVYSEEYIEFVMETEAKRMTREANNDDFANY